jgi:hypothetical protein
MDVVSSFQWIADYLMQACKSGSVSDSKIGSYRKPFWCQYYDRIHREWYNLQALHHSYLLDNCADIFGEFLIGSHKVSLDIVNRPPPISSTIAKRPNDLIISTLTLHHDPEYLLHCALRGFALGYSQTAIHQAQILRLVQNVELSSVPPKGRMIRNYDGKCLCKALAPLLPLRWLGTEAIHSLLI